MSKTFSRYDVHDCILLVIAIGDVGLKFTTTVP